MQQVLFEIPTPWFTIPIYGFGMMLFVAFLVCTWLAGRRAEQEGVDKHFIQDMGIWIFIVGIIGARIVWMIQYRHELQTEGGLLSLVAQFFEIWKGGLVFYGSAIGGVVGYFLYYRLVLHKHGISSWKIADIAAPSAAIGLCLGRIGCLLNGCCYGNVACPDCPALHFPIHSPPWGALVYKGYQTSAGFTLRDGFDKPTVAAVESGSPAAAAGLRAGDMIVKANEHPVQNYSDLIDAIFRDWPRGEKRLALTISRDGEVVPLEPFRPTTIGLHPTQLYESISMLLLFFLLTAFYPFRRHDGEVMVLFMLGYAVHRFVNEVLRNDTSPVALDMTLSQNGSILVLAAGLLLGYWLWRQPVQYPRTAAP